MERVTPRVSFADLQRMPDNGDRYELYDGALRVVPSPLPWHQIVGGRLYEALVEHRRRHGGLVLFSPLDIVLSEHDIVQPDLVYFGPRSARAVRPHEAIRFTPDLAIEVLSSSTASVDRGRKRDLFARFGLPEYWAVDPPSKRIELSVLNAGHYGVPLIVGQGRLRSPTVEGLVMDVEPLFADFD
ncbi:MAG: Uma2 family endonuclease [Vicinamibacterales bacterium]